MFHTIELMIILNNLLQGMVNQQAKRNTMLKIGWGGEILTYILNDVKNEKLFDDVVKISVFSYLRFMI